MIRLPKFVRSLVGCVDADSSRYALGGVRVEARDGVANLVATDGRILVNVSYAAPECGEVECIVEGKSLSKAVATVAKAKCDETLEVSTLPGKDGKPRPVAMISGRKVEHPAVADLAEGRFPRWRDVFPAMEPKFSIRLDCELLSNVCKVFADAGASRATFHFTDKASAVRIDAVAPTGEVIRGVVMPVDAEKIEAPLDGYSPAPVATVKAG